MCDLDSPLLGGSPSHKTKGKQKRGEVTTALSTNGFQMHHRIELVCLQCFLVIFRPTPIIGLTFLARGSLRWTRGYRTLRRNNSVHFRSSLSDLSSRFALLSSPTSNLGDDLNSEAYENPTGDSWEELGTNDDDALEIGGDVVNVESGNPLLDEYKEWYKSLTKAAKAAVRKRDSLSNEVKKAEEVEGTTRRAQLITSNMYLFSPGVKSATVQDWENDGQEIELTLDDSYVSASEEADALFQRVRKLKRGSAVVKDLLIGTLESLAALEEVERDMKACVSEYETVDEPMFRLLQRRLIQSSRRTGFSPPPEDGGVSSSSQKQSSSSDRKRKAAMGTPASNIRKLMSPGGCIVLVGRNRRGNEHLTFNVARGDDIWMQ